MLSELTRRRIRSVSKLIKVGRVEPVMVLRVDKEKGYIDLSKRRVSPEDVAAAEEKYNKSKMVHSILRHVAETTPGHTLEELYEHMAWPLYESHGHCFEAFKQMVSDPDRVLNALKRPDGSPAVDAAVKEALVKDIRRRMTPQPLKIRADVELTCFAYDGVMHIKDAMRAALADAGFSPHDVDYVNAHATGTRAGDEAECNALLDVFGSRFADGKMAVSSTKGAVGHLLGAAGAVEAAFAALSLFHAETPPTLHLTPRGDEASVVTETYDSDSTSQKKSPNSLASSPPPNADLVRDVRRRSPAARVAMTNSFGFGGTNASLVFAKAPPLREADDELAR